MVAIYGAAWMNVQDNHGKGRRTERGEDENTDFQPNQTLNQWLTLMNLDWDESTTNL